MSQAPQATKVSSSASPAELDPYPASAINPIRSPEVDLKMAETWYWGRGNTAYGSIQAKSQCEDGRFLSMEKFESALADIHCNSNSVAFSFNDEKVYDAAKMSFRWLNERGQNSILLVTEHPACGENKRQPFQATGVKFSDLEMKATFDAKQTTWEDGIKEGTIKYNTKGFTGIGKGLEERFQVSSPHLSPNLQHDFSGTTIFNEPFNGINAALVCTTCNTGGKLDFEISVDVPSFELSYQLDSTAVEATVDLDLKLDGAIPSPISKPFSLGTVSLGGLPPFGPVTAGANLDFEVVTEITQFSVDADISFGVNVALPDQHVVFPNDGQGIQGPQLSTSGPTVSGSVDVSGGVTPEIIFSVGLSAFGFSASAGVALAAPNVSLHLTAENDGSGVCGTTAPAGVEFDANVGVGLDIFGGKGAATDLPNLKNIFTTSAQIFSTCITAPAAAATSTTASAPPPTITFTSFNDDCCATGCGAASGFLSAQKLTIVADGNTCAPITAGGVGGLNSAQFVTDSNSCTIQFFEDSACATPSAFQKSAAIANGTCVENNLFGGDNNAVNFIKMSCTS